MRWCGEFNCRYNGCVTPWDKFKKDWQGKRVLIMGLGVQGRGVGDAKVFAEAGAQVTVTDLKREDKLAESFKKLAPYDIRFVLGRHDEEDFKTADVVIRNPAVPRESPFLEIARAHGVPIKMDSSLFATYFPRQQAGCPLPIIGITGTRGKTTTTMMIYEVLKKHLDKPVFLGGNVPGKATLELLREVPEVPQVPKVPQAISPIGLVILELSSWELEGWEEEKISPHIAVFTNFSEDHLNRYASMEEYFQGKLPITNHQLPIDWLVVNRDNEWTRRVATSTKAQVKWFSADDFPTDVPLSVPGEHNRANAAAALAVAEILGIDRQDALETLRTFDGVPGRLETIATIDGVTYVNDTTATTPTAGIVAIQAIKRPIILICGGSSKKLHVRPFIEEVVEKVKHVVLLKGDATEEMLSEIASLDSSTRRRLLVQDDDDRDSHIDVFDNFREALDQARELAHPGDVVLLSPGFASFSMFKNEFDRGQQFNDIVSSWQKRR